MVEERKMGVLCRVCELIEKRISRIPSCGLRGVMDGYPFADVDVCIDGAASGRDLKHCFAVSGRRI